MTTMQVNDQHSDDDYKLPLRQWLVKNTEKGFYGFEWYDKEQNLIKIPWTAKGQPNWDRDMQVPIAWAKHRGKYDEANPPDDKTLKGNFRGVLHKSDHFRYMQNLSVADRQTDNYRVYKLLSPKEVKQVKKRSHPRVEDPFLNNSIEAPRQKKVQDASHPSNQGSALASCSCSQLLDAPEPAVLQKSISQQFDGNGALISPNIIYPGSTVPSTSYSFLMEEKLVESATYNLSADGAQQGNPIGENVVPVPVVLPHQSSCGWLSSHDINVPVTSNSQTSTLSENFLETLSQEIDDNMTNMYEVLTLSEAVHEGSNNQIVAEHCPAPILSSPVYTNQLLGNSTNYLSDSRPNDLPELQGNLFPNDLTTNIEGTEATDSQVNIEGSMQQLSLQSHSPVVPMQLERNEVPCNNLSGCADVSESTESQFSFASLEEFFREFNISYEELFKFQAFVRYNGDMVHTRTLDLTKLHIMTLCGSSEWREVTGTDGVYWEVPEYEGTNSAVRKVVDSLGEGMLLQVVKKDGDIVLQGIRRCRSHVFYFDNCDVTIPNIEMRRDEEVELFSYCKYIVNLLQQRQKSSHDQPDCEVMLAFGKQPSKPTSRVPISLVLQPVVASRLVDFFYSHESLSELSSENSSDLLIRALKECTRKTNN